MYIFPFNEITAKHSELVEFVTDHYIAKDGTVYAKKRINDTEGLRIVSQYLVDGQPLVSLTLLSGKAKIFTVARLVAIAFIGPQPTPGHFVARLDGNPANITLGNLEWRKREGPREWRTIKTYAFNEIATKHDIKQFAPGCFITRDGTCYAICARKPLKGLRVVNPYLVRGYYMISFDTPFKNQFLLHRLIMQNFGIPQPSPNHVVAHLDGNKVNNDISNLAWLTRDAIYHSREHVCKGYVIDPETGTFQRKFTKEEVQDMRRMKRLGVTLREIVSKYAHKATDSSIHAAIYKRTYKDVV